MDKLLGYLLVGIIGYVVVVALLNTLGIPEGWSWAIPAIIILLLVLVFFALHKYGIQDAHELNTDNSEEVEYHIVGMKYRKLTDDELESFSGGYLMIDPDNQYDSEAVGVYNFDEKCVGYIPRPYNVELFTILQQSSAGTLPVRGWIDKSYDYGKKAWVGRVYVKKKYFNTSNNQEYN